MVDTSDCSHRGVAHGAKDYRPLPLSGEGHWLEQRRRTGVRRIGVQGILEREAVCSLPTLCCAGQFAFGMAPMESAPSRLRHLGHLGEQPQGAIGRSCPVSAGGHR
jgi:hypothetical protein